MNKEKLFRLNSAESEIFVELQLVLSNRLTELVGLIKAGYGIYPEVLNAVLMLGEEKYISEILSAGQHEKYDEQKLLAWLQAYYESDWKAKVGKYGFIRIARNHLTSKECEKYQLWDALKYANKAFALEVLAKNKGIDFIKQYYISKFWNKSLSSLDKEEAKKIEKFLCEKQEHDFLYAYNCFETLGTTISGCQYVASKGNYSLLLSFISWFGYFPNWKECRTYCLGVLQRAETSLSPEELKDFKEYRRRFK
ncbi:MAG: hypothetical protein IJ660_02430 [Alphaproteobacteria bacterium]|nr:hypothetical protein [Alphaproteobacteria bacterium]